METQLCGGACSCFLYYWIWFLCRKVTRRIWLGRVILEGQSVGALDVKLWFDIFLNLLLPRIFGVFLILFLWLSRRYLERYQSCTTATEVSTAQDSIISELELDYEESRRDKGQNYPIDTSSLTFGLIWKKILMCTIILQMRDRVAPRICWSRTRITSGRTRKRRIHAGKRSRLHWNRVQGQISWKSMTRRTWIRIVVTGIMTDATRLPFNSTYSMYAYGFQAYIWLFWQFGSSISLKPSRHHTLGIR